jgi:hypothetical protein
MMHSVADTLAGFGRLQRDTDRSTIRLRARVADEVYRGGSLLNGGTSNSFKS